MRQVCAVRALLHHPSCNITHKPTGHPCTPLQQHDNAAVCRFAALPQAVPKGPPTARNSLHVSGLPPWAADEDLRAACQVRLATSPAHCVRWALMCASSARLQMACLCAAESPELCRATGNDCSTLTSAVEAKPVPVVLPAHLLGACVQEAGHGKVLDAYIIPDTDYGFVTLSSDRAVKAALQGDLPIQLGGQALAVKHAFKHAAGTRDGVRLTHIPGPCTVAMFCLAGGTMCYGSKSLLAWHRCSPIACLLTAPCTRCVVAIVVHAAGTGQGASRECTQDGGCQAGSC